MNNNAFRKWRFEHHEMEQWTNEKGRQKENYDNSKYSQYPANHTFSFDI